MFLKNTLARNLITKKSDNGLTMKPFIFILNGSAQVIFKDKDGKDHLVYELRHGNFIGVAELL